MADLTSRRPWSVGQSKLCQHSPRCANIWISDDDHYGTDVTFPCSGLSVADATLIVAAVNVLAAGNLLPDLHAMIAAVEAEWRRVAELASAAARVQGRDPAA